MENSNVTFEAQSQLIEETKQEIEHLESISTSLDIALKEEDLTQIKQELTEYGFIKSTVRLERK
ncbi:MAG: NFACT family protein [Clostridium fessum]